MDGGEGDKMSEKRVASIFDLVRMCKSFDVKCDGCPLYCGARPCHPFDFTDKDNDLILAWCDENQQKTYLQDFFEKFPSCLKKTDGTPALCRDMFYGLHTCKHTAGDNESCVNCWNEIMQEEETK